MQVTQLNPDLPLMEGRAAFRITAETQADQALLDALDILRPRTLSSTPIRTRDDALLCWVNSGAELRFDSKDSRLLVRDAVDQTAAGLVNLFELLARQGAQDGHVGRQPANPQPQETPAALLEQLQHMADALRSAIGQLEPVLKEMMRTHEATPVVNKAPSSAVHHALHRDMP